MAATVSRTEYGFIGAMKAVLICGHWTGTDQTASISIAPLTQMFGFLQSTNGVDDVIYNTNTLGGDDALTVPASGKIDISRLTMNSASKFCILVIGT